MARESSRVGARGECFAADADRVDRIRGDRFGDGAGRSRASQLTRATPAIRANQSRGRPSPNDRPGPEGSADAQTTNSAADAAGLEQLGLCIAGLKRPPARRGGTTEAVAKEWRAARNAADCSPRTAHADARAPTIDPGPRGSPTRGEAIAHGSRWARAARLAHRRDEAAVPRHRETSEDVANRSRRCRRVAHRFRRTHRSALARIQPAPAPPMAGKRASERIPS